MIRSIIQGFIAPTGVLYVARRRRGEWVVLPMACKYAMGKRDTVRDAYEFCCDECVCFGDPEVQDGVVHLMLCDGLELRFKEDFEDRRGWTVVKVEDVDA